MAKLPKGAVGKLDDFRKEDGTLDYEALAGKHIASESNLVFDTEEAYSDHVSPVTGHSPTEVEHLDATSGGEFSRASAAAQERGAQASE